MTRLLGNLLKYFIILIITIICVFSLIKLFKIDKKLLMKLYPLQYNLYVEEFSKKYNVDKDTIFAIIKSESNFKTQIISSSGALGLMQLMQTTADEVAEKINLKQVNLFDAKTNIEIGTKYFSMLYKKYNNEELALAAYNAGVRKC